MAGRSSRRQHRGGNERIQALVQDKLDEGLQYEALQLYRGVVARKSARGDHDGAISIAEHGIGVLLAAKGKGVGGGEEGCFADSATELSNVLVGILTDHELPCTEERLAVITSVNAKFEDAKREQVRPWKYGTAQCSQFVAQVCHRSWPGYRVKIRHDETSVVWTLSQLMRLLKYTLQWRILSCGGEGDGTTRRQKHNASTIYCADLILIVLLPCVHSE